MQIHSAFKDIVPELRFRENVVHLAKNVYLYNTKY